MVKLFKKQNLKIYFNNFHLLQIYFYFYKFEYHNFLENSIKDLIK